MEEKKTETKTLLSRAREAVTAQRAFTAFICVIALLLAFHAGKAAGYRKASFSYGWGENYHRNFGGPERGLMRGGFGDREFIDGHGTFGQIMAVDEAGTFLIKGRDGIERSVVIGPDAFVRKFRDRLSPQDLRAEDMIVVIGAPDGEGRINAKFVRVLPPPPPLPPPGEPGRGGVFFYKHVR